MKKFLLPILIIFINVSIFSQSKYDVDHFFTEGRIFAVSPKDWQTNDYIKLSVILGATYGLMHVDKPIKESLQKYDALQNSIPVLFGRFYGTPYTPVLLSAFFLIQGNSTGNQANKRLGFEIAQSFFYSVAITGALKFAFGRERPYATNNPFNFSPFSFKGDAFLALPSGHTTVAFALSTVLSENSKTDFWKVVSFVPAVLTAFSRVYENKHWTSDVFFGAAIGYFTAKFFTKIHNSDFSQNEPPSPLVSLSIPIN